MGRHEYKCWKCRRDKKKCELLTYFNTIIGCRRCLGMLQECNEFSFKDEHDDFGRSIGISLNHSSPPPGDSTRGALRYYSRLEVSCRSGSARYHYDVSANESMVKSLRQLRRLAYNRRLSAAALDHVQLEAYGHEAIISALSDLDQTVEMMRKYSNLCLDALYEARQQRAISRNEEAHTRNSCEHYSTITSHENIGRVIGDIMEQKYSTDATALSASTERSAGALAQLHRPGTIATGANAPHVVMLSKTTKLLLQSRHLHSHRQYCPVLLAARFHWVDALQSLIEGHRGLLSCLDLLGRNLIHILADTGQVEALTKLLHMNPLIKAELRELANSEDCQGLTPVAICAYKNQVGMFHVLQKLGANISGLDSKFRSILDLAVSAESTAIVQACFKSPGFCYNIDQGMTSPLLEAVKLGNLQIVRLLIDNGANPFWSRIPMSKLAQDQRIREVLEKYENELLRRGQGWPQTGEEVSWLMQQP